MSEKKVDEEWKKQAAEEKDEIDAAPEQGGPLPDADFKSFLSGLATQVLLCMGDVENPMTKQVEKNLPQAKYTIDLLQILKDKTKGNLEPAEIAQMSQLLPQLRMAFVETTKAVQAAADGEAAPEAGEAGDADAGAGEAGEGDGPKIII